jgi:hypothetical protein
MTAGVDPKAYAIGAGTLYIAQIGTAEPASISAPWDPGFVGLGYTQAGTTFTTGATVQAITPAESYFPLANVVTERTSTVDFELLQMTARNMQIAMNGGTITAVGGGGGYTFDPPAPGQEVRWMIGWDSQDKTERFVWRQCFQIAATKRAMQKTTPAAGLTCSFSLELPGGGLQPFRYFVTAARYGS